MGVPCRIRPASRADLSAVAAVEAASFADPWPVAAFDAHLDDCFLVAETEGAVVAFLVARAAGDEAEILDVAVAPGDRGRGVARALLLAALAEVRRRGARSAYLEVRVSNAAALGLYQSLGFRIAGRRRGYYRRPREDALVLARALTGDAA